jgi:hypothetical protein
MVPLDCGSQHVAIKQVNHGGNCSSPLKISSRETGRPMESGECFPFRRMIRTLFRGFGLGRSKNQPTVALQQNVKDVTGVNAGLLSSLCRYHHLSATVDCGMHE